MIGPETSALVGPARIDPAAEGDDALVSVALAEPGAFGLLYERYYDRVYRYCRSRTQTHEDCIDLTQQIFVQAFQNLHHYRPRGSSFAAWLFRIAHNALIDAGRRRKHNSIPWDDMLGRTLESCEAGPEETALMNDEIARLRRAINRLSVDQQELLVLRFSSGLTVREIGAVIGKSESATQMRIWRTLRVMRKELRNAIV